MAIALVPLDVEFRPLEESHLAMLHAWLQRPHVAQWWGPAESIGELRQSYLVEPGGTRAFIAHLGSEPIGFIQSYVVLGSGDGWWPDETDPGARGTDQFLADADRLGQGLGSALLGQFLGRLFADPSVTVVQTDPHPDNARAIRAYRRAGFRDAALVRTPDGPAWLMRCTRADFDSLAGARSPMSRT